MTHSSCQKQNPETPETCFFFFFCWRLDIVFDNMCIFHPFHLWDRPTKVNLFRLPAKMICGRSFCGLIFARNHWFPPVENHYFWWLLGFQWFQDWSLNIPKIHMGEHWEMQLEDATEQALFNKKSASFLHGISHTVHDDSVYHNYEFIMLICYIFSGMHIHTQNMQTTYNLLHTNTYIYIYTFMFCIYWIVT